jgi:hypothetical protein
MDDAEKRAIILIRNSRFFTQIFPSVGIPTVGKIARFDE